jgi:hypothetical protein
VEAEVLPQGQQQGQEGRGSGVQQLEALRRASIKLASSADVDIHLLPPGAKVPGQMAVLALHEHL